MLVTSMIGAVWQMEADERDKDLNALWRILGGGGDLFVKGLGDRRAHVGLLVGLIQEACGQHRDPYVAERRALSDLAEIMRIDPAACPTTDDLETAILNALKARLGSPGLEAGVKEEMEAAVKTLSDDQRLQLLFQVSEGYAKMTVPQRHIFADEVAAALDISEEKARDALERGPAGLLTIVTEPSGSSARVISTKLLSAVAATGFSGAGFAAIIAGSAAVPFLAGPVAMLMLALIPKPGGKEKFGGRKRARARKLIQIVVFIHATSQPPIAT
jgi:hypothetical protein